MNNQINIARYHIFVPLQIRIDGPYGAPASNIFRASHAVLIATGIGVTPFSSILQSIMFRYWQSKNKCPKCQHSWTSNMTKMEQLKKVLMTSIKITLSQQIYRYTHLIVILFTQRWISSGLIETNSPSSGSYIYLTSSSQSRQRREANWKDFLIYTYT